MAHFLHTADLHLGRAFGFIGEAAATELSAARFQVLERIAGLVDETGAAFVIVAGDLFDSRNPDGRVLASAMEAVGRIPVPVYAIPGNHDPAGPYGPWASEKCRDYRQRYAPNLHLLDEAQPLLLHDAKTLLLPCPASGRPGSDPTAWLRDLASRDDLPGGAARIGIAHGGTVDFPGDVEQSAEISLPRLPRSELDYLALGDWHGARPMHDDAYRYAGTPEPDRFPRGDDYRSGVVLEVRTERGATATVTEHVTARYQWRQERRTLRHAADVARLDEELLAAHAQGGRLLRLELEGSLGIEALAELDRCCERLVDVCLHVDIERQGLIAAPTDLELEALAGNAVNPATRTVAQRLIELLGDAQQGDVARLALVKLHEATAR